MVTSSTGVKKPAAAKKTTAKKTTAKKTTKSSPAKTVAKSTATASSKAAAAAKKSVAPVATSPSQIDGLDVPQVFPLDDLASIKTASEAGVVYRLDGGFLDGLRMQVRRFESSNEKGLSIEFKIAGPSRATFETQLEKKGAKKKPFEFHKAEPKKKGGQVVLERGDDSQEINSSFSTHAPSYSSSCESPLAMDGANWKLDFVPDKGPVGLAGYVRLEVTGTPAQQQKALKAAINKAGLQQAFAPPNATAVERFKLMKLLWHTKPSAAKELSKKPLSDLKIPAIKKALKAAGVSDARINKVEYRQVAPGHFAPYDPGLVTSCKKAGLKYCYSTVTDPEHVLSIVQGGQKATLTRWTEGALITGMSSMSDVGSGGAQGVFSRLVVPSSKNKSWTGRTYKIILKPEQMGRLDIWGWPGDNFGQSWDLESKNFGAELVKSVEATEKPSSYATSNEIISPVGNGPEFFAGVVATSESDRTKLIDVLKKAKFQPPEGKTIAQFVLLAPNIDLDLMAKAAPKKKAPKKKAAPKKAS